jgi:hypothetical protein
MLWTQVNAVFTRLLGVPRLPFKNRTMKEIKPRHIVAYIIVTMALATAHILFILNQPQPTF